MAIDITALSDYVKLYPELLTTVIYEDTILKRIPVTEYPLSTPGKYLARIFTPVANLQDCCVVPDGTSNVVEKELDAICLLDGQEYCETDLAQILRDESIRFTAGQEDAGTIEQTITEGQLSAFTAAIDTLIFQGDTASADNNLNKYDGLIKKANASANTVKVTITATNVEAAIRQVVAKLPRNARKMGNIGIFVPEEFADALSLYYTDLNNFHFNPADYEIGADLPVRGLRSFTIVPCRGLNGTGTIIATPFKNITWLYNRRDDINTLDWDYSKYHQRYYWRIKTIFGIDFVIDQFVVIATYDEAILTGGPAVDVNIISPLDPNTGGIATTTV